MKFYSESDFVKVTDGTEAAFAPVPKAWVGTGLLPDGVKRVGGRRSTGKSDTDESPSGNASREDWATYAKAEKGATDEDLKKPDGEDLTRDELRAKFGSDS